MVSRGVDEFEAADREAGEESYQAEVMVPEAQGGHLPSTGVVQYREQLVQSYHGGAASLVERLRNSGDDDAQSLVVALIDEVIKETDNLLGNQLVASQNGELRDASVISFKRAEVLEKAIKAVNSKRALEQESGIDLDSPSMTVVFRYFLGKVKEVFEHLDMPDEQVDLFLSTLGEMTDNWKKELREELDMLKVQ